MGLFDSRTKALSPENAEDQNIKFRYRKDTVDNLCPKNTLLQEFKMEWKPAPVREDGDGRLRQSSRYASGGGKERVFQGVSAWGGGEDHIGMPWRMRRL